MAKTNMPWQRSNLRDNDDGTCNCHPLGDSCFFQEFDGSRCQCKCHRKPIGIFVCVICGSPGAGEFCDDTGVITHRCSLHQLQPKQMAIEPVCKRCGVMKSVLDKIPSDCCKWEQKHLFPGLDDSLETKGISTKEEVLAIVEQMKQINDNINKQMDQLCEYHEDLNKCGCKCSHCIGGRCCFQVQE